MKQLSVLLFLLCVGKVCCGQSFYDISGRITNKDRIPISGSHIYLHGTNVGTVSNAQGFFRLKIPTAYCHSNVIFSHVGFVSTSKEAICGKQDYLIMLSEHVKELGEIEVLDMSAEQIVEKVISNLYKNYQKDSVNYQIFSRLTENTKEELIPLELEEAVINLYHESKSNPKINIIKARGKGFGSMGKKLFEEQRLNWLYTTGSHIMLRYVPDFLKRKKMKKYRYELDKEIKWNGSIFYVITIQSNKYIKYGLKYGEIWIHKENFGIAYLKRVGQDEKWKDNIIRDRTSESYYVQEGNKWFFTHGRRKYTHHMLDRKITSESNHLSFVIETTSKRAFNKGDEMGLMIQMLKNFRSDFNDDFWEAYNYIPLDEVFERALINAKIP